jgi:hypothetical protein
MSEILAWKQSGTSLKRQDSHYAEYSLKGKKGPVKTGLSTSGPMRARTHYSFIDFLRDVDETCGLLGYYAASCGNCSPTFRDNVSAPSSRVKSPSSIESQQFIHSRPTYKTYQKQSSIYSVMLIERKQTFVLHVLPLCSPPAVYFPCIAN